MPAHLGLSQKNIRYHSRLWDHRSTGQLLTLIPRRSLKYYMMNRVRQLTHLVMVFRLWLPVLPDTVSGVSYEEGLSPCWP